MSARAGRSGQGLVEFALVLPVILLIAMIALDSGRLFVGWVGLQGAARVAANYAAAHPDAAWGSPSDPDVVRYASLVGREATALGCVPDSPVPSPSYPAGTALGALATVQLGCRFDLLTPMVANVLGHSIFLGATTSFPVRSGSWVPAPTPSPIPSPSPTPTPTPSPTPCVLTAPNYVTQRVNAARTNWNGSGFTGSFTANGSGNFAIGSQSIVAGQPYACSTSITVAP